MYYVFDDVAIRTIMNNAIPTDTDILKMFMSAIGANSITLTKIEDIYTAQLKEILPIHTRHLIFFDSLIDRIITTDIITNFLKRVFALKNAIAMLDTIYVRIVATKNNAIIEARLTYPDNNNMSISLYSFLFDKPHDFKPDICITTSSDKYIHLLFNKQGALDYVLVENSSSDAFQNTLSKPEKVKFTLITIDDVKWLVSEAEDIAARLLKTMEV